MERKKFSNKPCKEELAVEMRNDPEPGAMFGFLLPFHKIAT
jgi:hypothetical protein